jgi:hypothetical protein
LSGYRRDAVAQAFERTLETCELLVTYAVGIAETHDSPHGGVIIDQEYVSQRTGPSRSSAVRHLDPEDAAHLYDLLARRGRSSLLTVVPPNVPLLSGTFRRLHPLSFGFFRF